MDILQVLVAVCVMSTLASCMTSDPSYYQAPIMGPNLRDLRRPLDRFPRLPYNRPTSIYPTSNVATLGRPYDVDYSGRQMRYRNDALRRQPNYMAQDPSRYYPGVAHDSPYAPAQQQQQPYGNDVMRGGYFDAEPVRSVDIGNNYRKMSYVAPRYGDDRGSTSGRYVAVGPRGGDRHPFAYADDVLH